MLGLKLNHVRKKGAQEALTNSIGCYPINMKDTLEVSVDFNDPYVV